MGNIGKRKESNKVKGKNKEVSTRILRWLGKVYRVYNFQRVPSLLFWLT